MLSLVALIASLVVFVFGWLDFPDNLGSGHGDQSPAPGLLSGWPLAAACLSLSVILLLCSVVLSRREESDHPVLDPPSAGVLVGAVILLMYGIVVLSELMS